MAQAVIFDMFETLITHYHSGPLYFGKQMAEDAGIEEEKFQALWKPTEQDRTIGRLTFEDVLEMILKKNHCYSEITMRKIVAKRVASKEECFRHLHHEILPMLSMLKDRGILVGLISNCFSEEADVIRRSVLFPYFDGIYLSYEQGIQKPNKEIFYRCIDKFSLPAEKCIYVGDGGSKELETAREIGMKAVQAAWYLQEGTMQPVTRKEDFYPMDRPLDIFQCLDRLNMV